MSADERRDEAEAAPLEDDDEYEDDVAGADDSEEEDEPRAPLNPRRIAAWAGAALAALLIVTPIGVMTVPAVSDQVLLPRQGPDLLLTQSEIPDALVMDLDTPKLPDLGIDDSPAGLARKAQLLSAGFGGGWVRTFDAGPLTPANGIVQFTSGTSLYTSSRGAHAEYERTLVQFDAVPNWKRFTLGTTFGDESTAWEQTLPRGHAVLVYYRYANILAQVSLTYEGPKDEAFAKAQSGIRSLGQKQVEKERLVRLRPWG